MLRITRHRQFRVSNRLAAMAALLLIVTAAAGLSNPFGDPNDATQTMADTSRGTQTEETTAQRVNATAGHRKRFKVNLYLFRRG